MSQVLINQYVAELDRLKKVGGAHRVAGHKERVIDLLARVATVSVGRCGSWRR